MKTTGTGRDLGDLGGIESGLRSTHMPADDVSTEVRAAQRGDARGNFAAIVLEHHGVDARSADLADLGGACKAELRELADALGLNERAREPGHCACGAVLPISTLFAGKGGYLNGRCLQCSTGAPNLPMTRVHPTPSACTIPQPAAPDTGWCRACDRTYRLLGDRRLRAHPAWETRDGARFRLPWDCDGSGLRPEDVEAP